MAEQWSRVPCSAQLRSEGAALRWWARWRAASVAAGLSDGGPVCVRVVQTRPPGWGMDGRPRFAVEVMKISRKEG